MDAMPLYAIALTDAEWNVYGYDSQLPCVICQETPTKSEPHFGYSVCRTHAAMSPVHISEAILRRDHLQKKKEQSVKIEYDIEKAQTAEEVITILNLAGKLFDLRHKTKPDGDNDVIAAELKEAAYR